MINTIRDIQSPVLVLDLGNVFPDRGLYSELVADVSLEAMEIMKYDAMNLGEYDLKLGVDYLVKRANSISFPYLSSNLIHDDTIPIKPYTIKHIGDKTVAILGIIPSDALNLVPEGSTDDRLKFVSPEIALEKLLPEISSIANYVILISRLSITETEALIADFKEIDLVITPRGELGTDDVDAVSDKMNQENKIVSCSHEKDIKVLEMLSVKLEENGKISINSKEEYDLNNSIPHDEQIDNLILNSYYTKLREKKHERSSRKLNELHERLKEGLNKTPEEFLKEQHNSDFFRPLLEDNSTR